MKIGILTSSRADYGIYVPLISKLSKDSRFELIIIAFGMHLQKQYGETIKEIERDNFGIIHKVKGMPKYDMPEDISKGYGKLIIEFSSYWKENKFDCVLASGDRFEMSAAVQAGIPFEVLFAHLHGGETTLGAIDNIYRHQITLASKMHFVASDVYRDKVIEIVGCSSNVFNVGALSLDGVDELILPDWDDVRSKFGIPDKSFILVTLHPETIQVQKNELYSSITFETLSELCQTYQIIITMVNADTMGKYYKDMAFKLKKKFSDSITLVDNFGKENYFSAMKSSKFLLGNSSSGIIEAASFGKYVVNVGNRQEGRAQSKNIINCKFDQNEMIEATHKALELENFNGDNIYFRENVADTIIKTIKKFL
ncbi:MAG: UDP-N-acetylglucosamine 2-epimerase [Flammeovirgaceae bacterium]